jgi:hypothetical protein
MHEHKDSKKSGQRDHRAATARAPVGGSPVVQELVGLQETAGNAAVAMMVQRFDWRDVADPLGVTTVGGGLAGMISAGVTDQGQFKRDVHAARQRPIWRAEWDAWGHAVCGAFAAGIGGSGHAWALGGGIEAMSEGLRILGIREHDSFREDTHNQAVGRAIGRRMSGASADELIRACTQSYLGGEILVGPAREDAWLPHLGANDYEVVRRHENRYWIPNRANQTVDPSEWDEAVDPGERGQARGTGAHPSTPLPAE